MISLKKCLSKLLGLEFYTSQLDQFLEAYDHTHTGLSHSQRKEKEKYKRIYKMRDNPTPADETKKFWDKF